MTYLLDTSALLELRKRRSGKIDPAVEAWTHSVDQADLYLSVSTVNGIGFGIARRESYAPQQARVLRLWLHDRVLPAFAGRILPIDIPVALRCARLRVECGLSEQVGWIAATGLVHGLAIVTRNSEDFDGTGATIMDPWTFTGETCEMP